VPGPRRCCARNLDNPAAGFEFNLSTLLENAARGERIVELPIQAIYEPGNPTKPSGRCRIPFASTACWRAMPHVGLF